MGGYSQQDREFMAQAIKLAARGHYTTHPNPRVGCILVSGGQIVGAGYHIRAGEGHAEVNALKAAGSKAQSATAYVTLEPCSHHGKTPPCAEALIKAGVSRVVSAMVDPNPQVSGRGVSLLQQAGIESSAGLLEAEAKALNPGFIKRMETGMPYVRIKTAASLDGRTAMQSGESQWITGAAARSDVQRLRAASSAIITGIDSILQDDSALTVRAEELQLDNAEEITRQQPIRVVLDSQLRLPVSARILRQPGRTIVATCNTDKSAAHALEQAGAEVLVLPEKTGHIDLAALLRYLASAEQSNEVLVETGATLAGAFISKGLADELIVYKAMTLLGSEGRAMFNLPHTTMAEQIRLQLKDSRMVGDDLKLTLQPIYSEKS